LTNKQQIEHRNKANTYTFHKARAMVEICAKNEGNIEDLY
jgi:hypothetical protein